MKKRNKLSKGLALALAALMLLSACSSKDPTAAATPTTAPDQGTVTNAPTDGGDPGTATATPDAPRVEVLSQGVDDTTIKIGTASLVSGAFAFIGQPAYDGLRACIDRFNAQGGVRGRTLKLIAVDDQFDAALGKAMVEQFVEQDKVFMIASLLGNVVETSLDYLREKQIPVINISSGLDVCYSENDPSFRLFQVQPSNITDARYLISRTLHESLFGPNKDEKLPADAKIAVVYGTDSASLSTLEHLKDQATKEGAIDRLVTEAVTADTFPTAIQKFKNADCQAVIFIGITSEAWVAAMDDAQWEVPYIGAYGTSTLQSYAPNTYKEGRPIYATVWGDYSGKPGQDMLDDMMDALSYCKDLDETTRTSYRDNNYCVAGYAYGMAVVTAFQRYNDNPEYDLNWDDFIKIMELEPFTLGAISFDYMNGKRMGVDTFAFVEYVGHPDTGAEEMIPIRPFEALEDVMKK